jgi:hypothetical protein
VLDPREPLQRHVDLVGREVPQRGPELVDEQLHPQLRRLVLDDEQHLVVMLRHAHRPLRSQQGIQLQVPAVGQLTGQVTVHPALDAALVGDNLHAFMVGAVPGSGLRTDARS